MDAAHLPVLNWLDSDSDALTRPGAIELQSAIHNSMLVHFANPENAARYMAFDAINWRQQTIIKSQHIMGRTLAGSVMEIGAGSGWGSSLVSMLPTVHHVYCVDYDPVAVNTLMPQVQKSLGASAWKIQRVLGTFNRIPLKDELDVIISLGALHHSENLYATFAECFNALKPGGWLIASEPTYSDTENNQQIYDRYKKEDPSSLQQYGRVTRHEENSDHYYRLCEYVASAYSAKFDVYPFVFDLTGNRNADDRTLAERRTANGFHTNVLYPYFAKNPANPVFDKLFIAMQKPTDGGRELGHVLSSAKLAY